MKSLPTPKESIRSLFEYMSLRYDDKRYPEVNITYQFVFTDIDDGYPMHITFSDGEARYSEGLCQNPSVTIRTPSELWLDISGGHRSPIWALIRRKYTVKGDTSALRLLPNLLTRKLDLPRSRQFSKEWTVPSQVLVLIGNPRKKNGLTMFYLQPFLDGLKGTGAAVEEIHLCDKTIKACLGCFHCWIKTPGICVQKDDQRELIDKLDAADLIIYALPLYYHSVPAQVKNHIDRQIPRVYPFFEKAGSLTRHPRRVSKKQSMVLFSIAGFPEIEQFEALVKTFEAYTRHDNVDLIAKILLPGAMEFYYNPTNRRILLEKVRHLQSAGEQLAMKGRVRKNTLKSIAKIPFSLDTWRYGANFHWYKEMNLR